jgi:tyrosine aminotransferase
MISLKCKSRCVEAVVKKLYSGTANGYTPSIGTIEARKAVASFYARPNCKFNETDVILASGCSDALNICIGGLADAGENILIPSPGFSLYETLASSKGISVKFYTLNPQKNWEIDLDSLESCIDENTRAIILNNPSNPCGSVYSKSHLLDIISVAEKHGLPIISDEIYADMVFKGI